MPGGRIFSYWPVVIIVAVCFFIIYFFEKQYEDLLFDDEKKLLEADTESLASYVENHAKAYQSLVRYSELDSRSEKNTKEKLGIFN